MTHRTCLAIALSVALAASVGCQNPGSPLKPTSSRKPKPSVSTPASVAPGSKVQHIPLTEPPRILELATNQVELIGKVKIISDNGGGIISDNGGGVISNNSGNIISDNGGGLVSNNGSNVVSNNGSSLIGKTKYNALQAGGTSAVPEFLLADAQIEVLDAAGNLLVDKDQKPIVTKTTATGDYTFKAGLPNENLILRIRLFNGGQLFAFATKSTSTAPRTVNIDTASSLGAAYVMDKYVQKKQTVLDLLPQVEAEKLQLDMEAARVHMASAVPTYQPQELVEIAETLRTKEPALNKTIERIEAILLAGQKNLGNGLKATQVTIGAPSAVLGDGQGGYYIAESTVGRIRKVAADGTVSVLVGPGGPEDRNSSLGLISHMVQGKQGELYVLKDRVFQVVKITPDGTVTSFAGTGVEAVGAVGTKAVTAALNEPRELAAGPDGTVYILERGSTGVPGVIPRLLYVDAQGLLQQVPTPFAPADSILSALAVGPDGSIYVVGGANGVRTLYRKKPGAEWETLKQGLSDKWSAGAVGPDGTYYAVDEDDSIIYRLTATYERVPVVGTKQAGYTGDGGPATAAQVNQPRSIWPAPNGMLYVADRGNNVVRQIDKAGIITTIAGTNGLTQVGDALTVAINQPGGLALDSQGRLLISEVVSHGIKRLDHQTLTTIAGTLRGFSGDGGLASSAAFDGPGAIAYHNGELFVMDAANNRLRKIDVNGVITTLAGNGKSGLTGQPKMPALETRMKQPFAMVIGPDGCPYWSDSRTQQIYRLKDNFVEVVAGIYAEDEKGADGGDGDLAIKAKFNLPGGLAFDKDGNLYVADTGNLRIRKIDKAGVVTTFAGMPAGETLAAVVAGRLGQDGDVANKAVMWGPVGLLFDAQGNLIFSEAGTVNAAAIGGSSDAFSGGAIIPLPANLIPKVYARLRKITPEGKVYNITGPGTQLLSDTTGDDMLMLPLGFLIDNEGRLVIADAGLNQLKMLPKGSF